MIYPLLSVLCSLIIANYLRLIKNKENASILSVFLGNYLLASSFSLFLHKGMDFDPGLFEIILGSATGFLFLVNFLIFQKNIAVNNLSLSVTAMRISVIIPVIASLSFFGESISILNGAGIIVIILSFLKSDRKGTVSDQKWLLLLFAATGMTDTSLKIFEMYSSKPDSMFLFIIFFSAFLFNLVFIIFGRSFDFKLFLCGLLLGIPNQLSSLFFLLSLRHYPAAIVYPLIATLIVIFSIISDVVLWKQRFSRKQRIFFALMVAGIILINIR